MAQFKLVSEYSPKGDQPQAIRGIVNGFAKQNNMTLLGVTGSGKTFTMANVIKAMGKPTLVLAHNKTLAAQLYNELRGFFPKNKVEYFVSYYDYYRPESYLPATDTYIEKDSSVNEKIDQMRLSATVSLISRRDVIIVASVSCIYSLGSPKHYEEMAFMLKIGQEISRDTLVKQLIKIQYERNDTDLSKGKFRVKGDVIDIRLGYSEDVLRIEMFGDEIESISILHPVDMSVKEKLDEFMIFPAKHFVIPEAEMMDALESIRTELKKALPSMGALEAHRLKQRTTYDLEMLKELGYCKGVENYSCHFDGRKSGESPSVLLDFFPEDFLIIIDESHVTIPQVHGMYKGDHARKKNLIDHGFRLPSAFDNRPLRFEEFEKYIDKNKVLFVSATPGDYEIKRSGVVEQMIRPTGLVDPTIEVRPSKNQIDDLLREISEVIKTGNKVFVTTLTKRMAEELTEYLANADIRVRYLHSEIDTLERTEIIRQLRAGEFDVLVGINLLREGLDVPEVALVAILDADKEGFLRTARSLIQTIGRAARNVDGKIVMYADKITDSMKEAISETNRRRKIQTDYNKRYDVTPKSIVKKVEEKTIELKDTKHMPRKELHRKIVSLEADMKKAAAQLDFEKAIELRDRINALKIRL